MREMKKYYIGLLILGTLTLGLSIYVVTLGIQSRQDVKTEKSAQEAAEKLNAYVDNKQKIPSSLSEAGVRDVPATISYSKISESEYKFCVTYKAASSGYNSADITSVVTGAALSRAYGTSGATAQGAYPGSTGPTYLYLGYSHKKGESCQNIKPNLYSMYDISGSSSTTDYCSPSNPYYKEYKTYCINNQSTPSTTVQ